MQKSALKEVFVVVVTTTFVVVWSGHHENMMYTGINAHVYICIGINVHVSLEDGQWTTECEDITIILKTEFAIILYNLVMLSLNPVHSDSRQCTMCIFPRDQTNSPEISLNIYFFAGSVVRKAIFLKKSEFKLNL